MISLIFLFFITVAVALFIPMRHLSRVRQAIAEEALLIEGSANSVARVRIVGALDTIEHWYQTSAKNAFLKALDRTLGIFERSAGRIAGQTKNVRMLVQEQFRVIPRESAYWKQIHTWKRSNTVIKAHVLREEEGIDISNHTYIS